MKTKNTKNENRSTKSTKLNKKERESLINQRKKKLDLLVQPVNLDGETAYKVTSSLLPNQSVVESTVEKALETFESVFEKLLLEADVQRALNATHSKRITIRCPSPLFEKLITTKKLDDSVSITDLCINLMMKGLIFENFLDFVEQGNSIQSFEKSLSEFSKEFKKQGK